MDIYNLKNTIVIKLTGCSVDLQGSLKTDIQYILYSHVLIYLIDEWEWPPHSQRRQEANSVNKI